MYNIAISVYVFLMRVVACFHPKAKKMVRGHRETFRILEKKVDKKARYIWFHAASLGEFEQGRPLMEKLKEDRPEYKILLTFFSPSGYESAKNYVHADIVCYLPFDFQENAKRLIRLAQPEKAIFIKYEFWYNYLSELKKNNIPTYLVSGIFREKQVFFRSYGKQYAKVLENFTHFFLQNKTSEELLHSKGLYNTSITGDTRFDRVHKIFQRRKEVPLMDEFVAGGTNPVKILVGGSTWEKDEDILIPYFNTHPEVRLIIAPHEFNKERLRELMSKSERPAILYSQALKEGLGNAEFVIVDSFGLLSSIYRYADIAYIGGGFGKGIHNILEAAVYGIPVLFGPKHGKFKEADDLIREKGGISVIDLTDFEGRINDFFSYSELLNSYGKSAENYILNNLGATNKIYEKIFIYTNPNTSGSSSLSSD